jgi:hypothetical protein
MVKCGVFFAVRTEFLNVIQTSFGFKGLSKLKLDNSDRCQLSLITDLASVLVIVKQLAVHAAKRSAGLATSLSAVSS